MSDHIIVNGKKYFEESYLELANKNTSRAQERIRTLEETKERLNKELDAGDSWAWIRTKFEKCRTQFKWYTPRTDSLVGTRYEVMGWLHVLFAHADPKVYIDITLEHQKKADDAEKKFEEHTKHVADFLNELYAIMVDPLADGEIKVADMTKALREAALQSREEMKNWREWGIIEIAVRNPNVKSYVEEWEGRALKAERKLQELHKSFAESIEARSR